METELTAAAVCFRLFLRSHQRGAQLKLKFSFMAYSNAVRQL